MGQVFLARHKALDRHEALKVLPPRLAGEAQFLARLRREARATTMLTHPNIVSVFGFGRLEDGRYYLAMEYLDGEPLDKVVNREGALPSHITLRLLYQLASAMAHAHDHAVVHRDIKPANLMASGMDTDTPNLKVLDFGLAKILAPSYIESVATSIAGTVFGTPGYMAPERVREVASAPTIDVYSFGCVAYTLMTGREPFVGRALDVLHAHQNEMPKPPGQCGTAVIPELEDIVLRCLAKDPGERFSDGGALCEVLAQIPGFSAEDARRRTKTPVGDTAVSGTAPTLREEQYTTQKTLIDQPGLLQTADTQVSAGDEAEALYQEELFALAEGLVEAGCRDVDLILCIASIQDARTTLENQAAKLRELLREGELLHQQFRHKQSRLRFALGDLSFDLAEDGSSVRCEDADLKANQLTEELIRSEHSYERAVQKVIEEEVTLCADRHSVDESRRHDFFRLVQLVDFNIDAVERTPELESLLDAFRAARAKGQSR